MRKKGQVHMSETIAVLFIFFVLLLFGIITYAKFQQGAIREKQEELLASRAIETATKVLFLPELACTKGEAESEDNCFDMAKVRYLRSNNYFEENIDYYFELFSYSTITIEQVYPEPEIIPGNTADNPNEIVLYDRQDPNRPNSESTFFVVSLKDEVNDQFGYGFMRVVIYS